MQRRAICRRSRLSRCSGFMLSPYFARMSVACPRSRSSSLVTSGMGWSARKVEKRLVDAVDGGDQEMARAHGDIGDAEVKEVVAGRAVAERFQPRQVVVQRRLQRVIEQVLDREALGVVGAGGFALAGGVVQVDFAGADYYVFRSRPSGTYKPSLPTRKSDCARDSSLCSKPS